MQHFYWEVSVRLLTKKDKLVDQLCLDVGLIVISFSVEEIFYNELLVNKTRVVVKEVKDLDKVVEDKVRVRAFSSLWRVIEPTRLGDLIIGVLCVTGLIEGMRKHSHLGRYTKPSLVTLGY